MRRNFDRNKDKLQQEHLKIISDQFVLQAQIKTIREQNADLDKQLKEYETVANKRNFDLDTEGKGLLKQKTDLDNENKSLDMQFLKATQEHYNNTMFLARDAQDEAERKRRHDKQQELNKELIVKKNGEKEQLKKDLEDLNNLYLGMADLQECIRGANELREKIEVARVKIQFLEVTQAMLAEANRLLTDRREQLQQEKQEAEEKRESLRAEVKTADDVAAKRLQTKLNRDKTQEAKELLAEEAQIQVYFDDVKNKLDDEKKKFDELLAGRQEIEEKLKRRTAKKDEDTAVVAE